MIAANVLPQGIGFVLQIINVFVSRDGKVLIVIKKHVHLIVQAKPVAIMAVAEVADNVQKMKIV